jgi:hypothetical protein
MKIQCISTNCGYYSELQLGKWYDAEIYAGRRSRRTGEYSEPLYLIKDLGDGVSSVVTSWSRSATFPKCLFRTLDERRDSRLDKILK